MWCKWRKAKMKVKKYFILTRLLLIATYVYKILATDGILTDVNASKRLTVVDISLEKEFLWGAVIMEQ